MYVVGLIVEQIQSGVHGTITKTRIFKYNENFTTKKGKFSDKKEMIFFISLLKT